MNNLKIDLINGAYNRIRISGLTVNPGARENQLALGRLENMAARWEDGNICAGYNFEEKPDLNSDSGIEPKYQDAFESNLAFWLCSDYGKTPPPTLALEQQLTFSRISASTAFQRQTQYPSRQPIGRGNRRYARFNKYYIPSAESPNSCETIKMNVGDINDFIEHFDTYLISPETIASYTIEADTGLTIVSDSLTSPDVFYRIQATGNVEDVNDPLLQVKIVATTSTGRIETRIINFALTVV